MYVPVKEGNNQQLDPVTKRVVWLLAAIIAFSFTFGIAMYLPEENRADKLDEMMARYQARNPDKNQKKPRPLNQPEW